MCGRINLRTSPAQLQRVFNLFRLPDFRPRYNIAPTQSILLVRAVAAGGRSADFAEWGFAPRWSPSGAKPSLLINARSETAATKPTFRESLRSRRCLIPADGFYEWQALGSRSKQPWHIESTTGQPLALAGLWEPAASKTETQPQAAAVILTTSANAIMAPLHDRMPVILAPADWDRWLDPSIADTAAIESLLAPCPAEWLQATPISSLVNQIQNDGPELIVPVDPAAAGSVLSPASRSGSRSRPPKPPPRGTRSLFDDVDPANP